MEPLERTKREAEAVDILERATRLAAGSRAREPLRRVPGAEALAETAQVEDRGASRQDDTVSADQQADMAHALIDWADVLESEDRWQEAYAFLRAAEALPKGPRKDPDLLESLCRLAIDLELEVDAARYRRRLDLIDPERLAAIEAREKRSRRVAAPVPVAPVVRYRHAKFGVGTLVRREENGLRVRFEGGERVIVEARLEKLEE